MKFLQAKSLSLSFGDRDLISNVTLNLDSKTRAALTGGNGCGKSTLMKVITNIIESDSGEIIKSKKINISYLPQTGIVYGENSIYQETEKAFLKFKTLEEKKIEVEKNMEIEKDINKIEELAHKQHKLQEKLIKSDYYHREEKINYILKNLGFKEEQLKKSCRELSGGWQMRIALAKILLENPDIMLLDEPTNYLDLETRDWLTTFLKNYNGGILLISHDRYFLDEIVNETYELFKGKLKKYKGNYSKYEKIRAEEIEFLKAQYEKQKTEIEKNIQYIERFKAKASKASSVKSREKLLEKMEIVEIPESVKKINLKFPPALHSGKDVLKIKELNKAYNQNIVLKNINFDIQKGEKVVITGINGAGKSTLLRIIAQEDFNYQGEVKLGTNVKIGYFAQDHEKALKEKNTILQEIEENCPTNLIPQVRNLLGSFLFSDDDINKKTTILSGGEKNRLSLLKLLLNPANLLILDEPTNHLDINSKKVLLQALKKYDGTIIFVSHDRYFIQNLATKVIDISNHKIKIYPDDYQYFIYSKTQAEEKISDKKTESEKNQSKTKQDHQEQKNIRNQKNKLIKQEKQLLENIEQLEKDIEQLQNQLSKEENYSDIQKANSINQKISQKEKSLEDNLAKWEEISQQIN